MKYARIWRAICEHPWAISPVKLAALLEIMELRTAGGRFTEEQIVARLAAAAQDSGPRQGSSGARGSVAVLPLVGVVSQRVSLIDDLSGGDGASTEAFASKFRQALSDPGIGSIVIDVDSPGGGVYGVSELADEIARARGGVKPVVAVANSQAASAAYWIAAAADELVVSPGGEVGSVGVYGIHWDESQHVAGEGLVPTIISAGKFKVEGNPYAPLDDEARAAFQARVDDYYGMFTKAIARFRGVGIDQVRNGFGEGRVVGARQAVSLGMADRVDTLGATIERLARGGYKSPKRGASADADGPELVAAVDVPAGPDLDVRRRRLRLHDAALTR